MLSPADPIYLDGGNDLINKKVMNWKIALVKNVLLAGVLVAGVLFGARHALAWYTNHDETRTVPDLTGLTPEEVSTTLQVHDLKMILDDSIQVRDVERGTIVQQFPQAGDVVKPGRNVYVTMVCLRIPHYTVPELLDLTERQALRTLDAYQIDLDEIERVEGDFPVVLNILANGKAVSPGDELPLNVSLTLQIGTGSR